MAGHQSFNGLSHLSYFFSLARARDCFNPSTTTPFNPSPDDVVDQPAEERLRLQVGVVLLGLLLGHVLELHRAEVVAAGLEAGDDLAHEAALDAVGLDHDEGGLHFVLKWGRVGGKEGFGEEKEEGSEEKRVCERRSEFKRISLRKSLLFHTFFSFSFSEKGEGEKRRRRRKSERAKRFFTRFSSFEMAAASVSPLPSSTSGDAAEEEEAAAVKQEAATTSTTRKNDVNVDRESIIAIDSLSSSSCSSLLLPNAARPRPRGAQRQSGMSVPSQNKDPSGAWMGLEWDDDGIGRIGRRRARAGADVASGRRERQGGGASGRALLPDAAGPSANNSGSLVRAAALDAPGVLVVGCSVEEALVRRYRSVAAERERKRKRKRRRRRRHCSFISRRTLLPLLSSFVAGHEEVAARLARIHELEVASVAGSPAAFCLKAGGGGRRRRRAKKRRSGEKQGQEEARRPVERARPKAQGARRAPGPSSPSGGRS